MARVAKDSIDNFLNHNIDLASKTIYLGSGSSECDVDENLASNIIKGLHILDRTRTDEPINLLINNRGGDTQHGLAIYDTIKSCQSPVVGKVIGSAESMGAWILQACDTRLMSPNSRLMLHVGQTAYDDHVTNVDKWIAAHKREEEVMLSIILQRIREVRPNYRMSDIKKKLAFDWILGTEEAIEWGLCDAIT